MSFSSWADEVEGLSGEALSSDVISFFGVAGSVGDVPRDVCECGDT